jgi:hypothetical protein
MRKGLTVFGNCDKMKKSFSLKYDWTASAKVPKVVI